MCGTHFVGVCKEYQKQNESNRISNTFRTFNSSLYNIKRCSHCSIRNFNIKSTNGVSGTNKQILRCKALFRESEWSLYVASKAWARWAMQSVALSMLSLFLPITHSIVWYLSHICSSFAFIWVQLYWDEKLWKKLRCKLWEKHSYLWIAAIWFYILNIRIFAHP